MSRTIRLRVLLQADVSYLLRRNLGPGRSWEDMLADMRSGETAYKGLVLLPYALGTPGTGTVGRPMYSPHDVAAFIAAARRADPPLARPADLHPVTIEIDSDALRLPWRMRRAAIVAPSKVAGAR